MNLARFLVGAIVVAVGVLFLGANVGWWSTTIWESVWQYWPVLFIFLGLSFLIRNSVAAVLAMVGVILLLIGLVSAGVLPTRSSLPWKMMGSNTGPETTYVASLNASDIRTLAIQLGGNMQVTITGDDSRVITAKFTGPQALVDTITLTQNGTTALLRESFPGNSFPFFTHWDQIRGTITLPKSVALDMDVSGALIGDIRAMETTLKVDASGASTLTFVSSKLTGATGEITGASKVTMNHLEGAADIELSGASKLHVSQAALTKLSANVSGASELLITSGTVVDADLDASGASKIRVPNPSGEVTQDNSGASDIDLF